MQNNEFTTSLEGFQKSDEVYAEILKENEKLARQRELENLVKMCHLKKVEDLLDNILTLHPYYIKFVEPIGNIRMISKHDYPKKTFDEAKKIAENSNLGKFTDWRLPTSEESELIYKLHVVFHDMFNEAFCETFPCNLNTWCTSEDSSENYFDNNSPCNKECNERSFILVR